MASPYPPVPREDDMRTAPTPAPEQFHFCGISAYVVPGTKGLIFAHDDFGNAVALNADQQYNMIEFALSAYSPFGCAH